MSSSQKIYYEDVIPDTAWTIQGREGVNKVRKHEDHGSFLGRDMSQWKITNYFDKLRMLGQDMREQRRNPHHTIRSRENPN